MPNRSKCWQNKASDILDHQKVRHFRVKWHQNIDSLWCQNWCQWCQQTLDLYALQVKSQIAHLLDHPYWTRITTDLACISRCANWRQWFHPVMICKVMSSVRTLLPSSLLVVTHCTCCKELVSAPLPYLHIQTFARICRLLATSLSIFG